MVMSIVGVVVVFIIAVLLVLTGNGYYLYNKFGSYVADITAKSPFRVAEELFNLLPNKNKIYVLVQLLFLFVFFVLGLTKTVKHKNRPKLKKSAFNHKKFSNEAQTDLDILYNALVSKKEIPIPDICELFKINRDLALDWCKTLENADLAIVDYPNFNPPILRLMQEEKLEEKKGDVKLEKKKDVKMDGKKNIVKKVKANVVKNNVKVEHNVKKEIKPVVRSKPVKKKVVKIPKRSSVKKRKVVKKTTPVKKTHNKNPIKKRKVVKIKKR